MSLEHSTVVNNYLVCADIRISLVLVYYAIIFFFSRLIQRWVENIIEAVRAASKETLRPEKIRPHMDNLTSQLLALSKSKCI